MTEKRGFPEEYRYMALGAVSALLYGTTIFAPFLTAPLQASWTRGGFRAFLLSFLTAAVGMAGWLIFSLREVHYPGFFDLLLMLSLPVSMGVSVGIINSRRIASWDGVYRALLGGCAAALLALPAVFHIYTNPGMEESLQSLLDSMTAYMGLDTTENYAAAVLRTALDARELLPAIRRTVANSYAAIIVVFTFLGNGIGSRLSAWNRKGSGKPIPGIGEFRVPTPLIWLFLGSWFIVLILRIISLKTESAMVPLEAIAWNVSLTVSFFYAVQGYGILRYFLGRLAPLGTLRFAGMLLLALLLFNADTSAWTAGALLVLGATETWIPYRSSKGVQT